MAVKDGGESPQKDIQKSITYNYAIIAVIYVRTFYIGLHFYTFMPRLWHLIDPENCMSLH